MHAPSMLAITGEAWARSPATVPLGELRCVERQNGGHTIREFVGRPASWMNDFAGPIQLRGEGKFLHENLGKN